MRRSLRPAADQQESPQPAARHLKVSGRLASRVAQPLFVLLLTPLQLAPDGEYTEHLARRKVPEMLSADNIASPPKEPAVATTKHATVLSADNMGLEPAGWGPQPAEILPCNRPKVASVRVPRRLSRIRQFEQLSGIVVKSVRQ